MKLTIHVIILLVLFQNKYYDGYNLTTQQADINDDGTSINVIGNCLGGYHGDCSASPCSSEGGEYTLTGCTECVEGTYCCRWRY